MSQTVHAIIVDVVVELNDDLEKRVPIEMGAATPLFGERGVLDSLGLVSLLVAVEQAMEDRMGVSLSLTDERALSQGHSPFATVGSLTDHVVRQLAATPS